MAYSVDAIRRRPGRSAATVFGIGLATGLVVLLLALSSGVQTSATRLAAASGIDLLATSANTSLSDGSFPPVTDAHQVPSELVRSDPNVASASPWLVGDLVFANSSLYNATNLSASGAAVPSGWSPTSAGAVGWIPDDNGGLETPATLGGAGFSAPGDPHWDNGSYAGPFTHEVELDAGLAALLHVGVGGAVWASDQGVAGPAGLSPWFANATALTVVGITQPFWLIPSALLGFLYLSELQALQGDSGPSEDFASLVLIHLSDPSDPGRDQSALAHAFPMLTFFTIGNILTSVEQAVNLYRTFGTLIGAIGLVVATLFTTTVLLMSVDDRSRELALLRAVGYTRARVGGLILQEGLLLGALGLGFGLLVGAAGAYGLNAFLDRLLSGLPAGFSFVSIDATVVAGGAAEVLIIGLLASLLPAVRAMGIPVAEELRAP
jgi:putative ABC transport system permease protein